MKFTVAALFGCLALACAQSLTESVKAAKPTRIMALRALPEEDFQEFLRLQVALLQSNRDDQAEMAGIMDQHADLIDSINSAFVALLGRVITLETEVAALKNLTDSNHSDVNDKINTVNGSVSELGTKLATTDSRVTDALNKFQTCVTGIRFEASQVKKIYRDYGYVDTKPYVQTGTENWDADSTVDNVYRRRFRLQRGGSWVDPEWL